MKSILRNIIPVLVLLIILPRLSVAAEKPEIFAQLGHSGPINSISFSPNGRYVVTAASEGGDVLLISNVIVKLWDAFSGREIRTLGAQERPAINPVSVCFSPDGRYIFSVGRAEVKIWDVADGSEIRHFSIPAAGKVISAAISRDGKTISILQESRFGIWDISSGNEIKTSIKVPMISNMPPGSRYYYIPLLYPEDSYSDALMDMETGERVKAAKTVKNIYARYAAISNNGTIAVFAGFPGDDRKSIELWDVFQGSKKIAFKESWSIRGIEISPNGKCFLAIVEEKDKRLIKVWDTRTGAVLKTFAASDVTTAVFSPDENVLVGDINGNLKLLSVKTGQEMMVYDAHKPILCHEGVVAISSDKKYLITLVGDCADPVVWDIKDGKIIKVFRGEETVGEEYLKSLSFAYNKDGKLPMHLYLSTTRELTADGSRLSFAPLKLYDPSSGKEIAQFITFKNGEWIVITPEGYFNASPNGAKYLNVRVGNNVYSIDNFYEKFFNPVYVASILQGKKIDAIADIRKGILTPPDVKITSPEPNASFSTDTVTIKVSAKDTGGGIDEIRLYHNGKAIGEDTRAVKIVPKGSERIKTYTIALVDGVNTFRAIGFSKDRTESTPYELIVKLTAPSKDVSLYVFAVGINKYQNPALNLNYAEPDARGIADFFKLRGKGLFENVDVREIYNEQATKVNIVSKLSQLQNINPQDAILIYLAGHGENINDKWYFIPHELTYPEREEDVKIKGISSDELSGYIRNIKAQKILLLIDACKSGAVLIAFRGFEDRKALSQLSRSTGVHIVAASTKDQFAAEVKDLGHGVFTHTLLEGLGGKAAGKGEAVTVRKLMGYVEEKLPEITKKYKQEAQYPVVDSRGMDFPLVIAK